MRAVEGLPIGAALREAEQQVSGSLQFRHAFAAERLAMGQCGSHRTFTFVRNGKAVDVSIEQAGGAPTLFDHPPLEERDGVVLVDLNALSWDALQGELDRLAHARAVVFDLREYPAPGTLHILEHLLTHTDDARGWMRLPWIDRPGRISGWTPLEWGLQPVAPRIAGKVVFLTSSLAISAAESILALVKGEHLGTLIGETTAGTNGNATGARLPGGYWIQFTGMRVVQTDGSPLHLRGIVPDVAAHPTLEGLTAERDEVRDAAVEWVRR